MIDHKLRHKRGFTGNLLGHLEGLPACKVKEGAPVVCISSVKLVHIEINTGKSKGGLEVSLVVCCVVDKVECVACIVAQGSRLGSWKADHCVEALACLARRGNIGSVRDVEL